MKMHGFRGGLTDASAKHNLFTSKSSEGVPVEYETPFMRLCNVRATSTADSAMLYAEGGLAKEVSQQLMKRQHQISSI